jgi:DNA-binding response OmpR family regulator
MQEQLLVVEDDIVLQLSLTAMLRREGFATLTARTVGEAQAQLQTEHPVIVLLDLGLPDGSGFDVLAQLNGTPDTPLAIVTTAKDSLAVAIEALRLGAFDFLTKPINQDLLRNALRRAIEHYQLRKSAREVERLRAHEEAMRATARAAAHHISQHLTVIMGEAQLLQEELGDPNAQLALDRIVQASEAAAQTLNDLRSARQFVVAEANSPEPILDLSAAVSKADDPAEWCAEPGTENQAARTDADDSAE